MKEVIIANKQKYLEDNYLFDDIPLVTVVWSTTTTRAANSEI